MPSPVRQSSPTLHRLAGRPRPGWKAGHPRPTEPHLSPPQSTSVSTLFWTPSLQCFSGGTPPHVRDAHVAVAGHAVRVAVARAAAAVRVRALLAAERAAAVRAGLRAALALPAQSAPVLQKPSSAHGGHVEPSAPPPQSSPVSPPSRTLLEQLAQTPSQQTPPPQSVPTRHAVPSVHCRLAQSPSTSQASAQRKGSIALPSAAVGSREPRPAAAVDVSRGARLRGVGGGDAGAEVGVRRRDLAEPGAAVAAGLAAGRRPRT